MKNLYVKQKIFSAGEKFTITDDEQNVHYYVQGSLFSAPKTFELKDRLQQTVATITKKILAFLPKFIVETNDQLTVEIKKDFSILKPHYTFSPQSITVEGDIFAMNFTILEHNVEIASIHKQWLSWGDTYEISMSQQAAQDQAHEQLIVALVVAIDYINAQAQNSSLY